MQENLFITFEGVGGIGKSTQVNLLYEYMLQRNRSAIKTHEPGGTEFAEKIRDLLLGTKASAISVESELLLFLAARNEHYRHVIEQNRIVICDRYIDSTIAYQGYVRGLDIDFIIDMHESIMMHRFWPDVTFILYVDDDHTSIDELVRRSNSAHRYDNIDFHRKVNSAFQDIGRKYPERCYLINGIDAQQNVHSKIVNILESM